MSRPRLPMTTASSASGSTCWLTRGRMTASPGPITVFAVLAKISGNSGSSTAPAALLPGADLTLLAPVLRPGKILCVGYNYVGHDAAGAVERPEFPEIFAKTANTVIGPEQAIILPLASHQVDYEAELAVVIGTGGRDSAESDAMGHVAGYTLFNDVS